MPHTTASLRKNLDLNHHLQSLIFIFPKDLAVVFIRVRVNDHGMHTCAGETVGQSRTVVTAPGVVKDSSML